ncbi:protein Asterix [Cornus florida]|uniref:protein Asterix n=1 Tax=Cornus florida TaxID=4283 RepID=UPI0028979BE5|nr:protein Asterix [Cornus florida]
MSSHNNSSSAANDPRQPSTAKPYVAAMVAPQDFPIDYSGFIALIFGIAGVMFRYKLSSWLAIIFCAQSLANMRSLENDLKQVSMAMMFAVMGLATNYFGPARPGTQS